MYGGGGRGELMEGGGRGECTEGGRMHVEWGREGRMHRRRGGRGEYTECEKKKTHTEREQVGASG